MSSTAGLLTGSILDLLDLDRVEILRAGFRQLMDDHEFLRDAKAQAADLAPLEGAVLQSIVEEAFSHPPEVVKRARTASGL